MATYGFSAAGLTSIDGKSTGKSAKNLVVCENNSFSVVHNPLFKEPVLATPGPAGPLATPNFEPA